MAEAFVQNPSDHWVRDTILEDLAEAQKLNGVMPTPVDNAQWLTGILSGLDQKNAEREGRTKPKPVERDRRTAAERINSEDGAELIRGDRVTEIVAKRKPRTFTPIEERLYKRWRLLARYPEWRIRMQEAHALGSMWTPERYGGGDEAQYKAVQKLLEDSNKTFGDWRNPDPGKPVYSI